ncbi:protein bunched, class 2/F/G isoform isoform X1 [Tribolium castaneum]|uniref:protein bunched, class 2/F/G isoform isoform X1 n=1 Tax=Tribolium castaneum TaxID=7070 RepID=UPI0001758549|nr:PREDICTED: protein bunched, class 2/F/G isoform isoform X1 [Tribolium castaneum]XP_008192716.1 PREDICTED: protein bunched, class 2/F/G isoform isoform X1 [Tribolium castaneum]|eukprot:XP_001806913.1 PREDICTED: protein bunched, class 2/F/G isoform isoform X1 [Tribolium castaneum]
MLPGNVDPRRPEKVQRYKPPTANANGQGEDLTPDYMNILGQRATTANASAEATTDKHVVDVTVPTAEAHQVAEEVSVEETNATNVIPTSPQYGVAIIPTNVTIADLPTETVTISTDSVIDTTAKPPDDPKDLHSTPSRNDRFKVVKIASLEPFKRGRWKCMDYVDEAPPPITQPSKVTQSTGSISVPAGGVYLQTQSLPQQQIQQMLLQSGFTNGTQFFPNVQAQMIPQTQYFYPPNNLQTQTLPQQLVNTSGVPSSMPAQFINASQPYFATGVVQNSGFAIPPNYQNVQYVPANILQNQGSAFVPTSQTVQLPANFQQSQTYAGQPNVTAPMVNGHAFPQQNEQQVTSSSLPTQAAKSVILNTSVQQPVVSQAQISQPSIQVVQSSTQSQSVPVIQNQQYQQNTNFQQVPAQNVVQNQSNVVPTTAVFDQNQTTQDKNQANNVYTNPQFDMNVNSLTVLENQEGAGEATVSETNEVSSENPDDPSKTNPVVNAIDNKIEQAMDLVKSHLMYTVREEVEVLKEKIAELMEKIQQLETENNFLRSQIPKSQAPGTATPILTTTSTTTTTATSTAPNETTPQQQQQ